MTCTRTVFRSTHAAFVVAALLFLSAAAQAQTYTVLHTFYDGSDSGLPYGGLTLDRAGNLYGTAFWGCGNGTCSGLVYKLYRTGAVAGRLRRCTPSAEELTGLGRSPV